jgi:hypothetical protein
MLLSGLFIATASRSDASPSPACPDGFSLTADAKNCFQAAVVSSADNPNSCDTGELTADGAQCVVAAQLIPQAGATLCPTGYSPDDSLAGMCARYENATQGSATCPAGSRGTAGTCYILVAKGPVGAASCTATVVIDTVTYNQVLVGANCVITGAAPTPGAATCPVSPTVQLVGGACYTLQSQASTAAACGADAAGPTNYTVNADDDCEVAAVTNACETTVATGVDAGDAVTAVVNVASGAVETCTYTPSTVLAGCGANVANGDNCEIPVDLVVAAATCAAGWGLIGTACIQYGVPTTAAASCPLGSIGDGSGDCRKPVADAAGAYSCADALSALNGKTCVWTTGFLVTPSADLYSCAAGARTVSGYGAAVEVTCILGAANANTTSGPSCLQGVLSTDNAYCIVARIDAAPAAVAAPVPSFTG